MPADKHITAGELKNWGYCPRVVFYRRRMPGASVPSYKMEAGIAAQAAVERLESRRTLAAYGWAEGQRRRGLWLTDEGLGLSGRVDYLLVRNRVAPGGAAAIVDFKLTSGDVGENHRLQLGGYALLVEARLGLHVDEGFIYRIPDDKVFRIAINTELRERIREALRQIASMEELPEPTDQPARCEDCEYANFCGDVW